MRGTALVETAVTLSFTLLLIFGALQMALMGYFQLQLDGATFFFTHAYASGSTDTTALNGALEGPGGVFPNVTTAITPIPYQPPVTDVSPNFTQWGTTIQRYGGASILRPQRLQAQANMQITASAFGGSINLSAGNVDARPVISNPDDDASGDDYNSAPAYNSVVDPLLQDDQNVPPYYITLAFIWYCNDATPWKVCQNRELRSLGLAEFLKNDNYGSSHTGIDQHDAPFYLMKCHQQIYAAISLGLEFLVNRQAAQAALNGAQQPGPKQSMPQILQTIYSWDYMPVMAESMNPQTLGQQYPLHPEKGC